MGEQVNSLDVGTDSSNGASAGGAFLAHDSDMARRIAAFDWASTSLGAVETWPQSLKTAVQLMLAMPQPATVCWGDDLRQLYNDRYTCYLGSRHPGALGMPLRETWREVAHIIDPAIERLFATGAALEYVNQELQLAGHGDQLVTTWVTGGWTPLRDESGRVRGFLGTTIDSTQHVQAMYELRQSEERQGYLLELSDALRPLASPTDIQREASRVLRAQLGASHVAYFDVLDDERGMIATGEDMAAGAEPFLGKRFRFSDFEPDAPQMLLSGCTQWRRDVLEDPGLPERQRAAYAAADVRSWMLTSLIKRGKLVACLGAFFSDEHDWTQEDTRIIEETAERTWAAVEQARAEAALYESEARLAADLAGMQRLYTLHSRLAMESDLRTALDEILAAASEFTGAERGCVQLLSDDGERLEMFAWRGYDADSPFIQRFMRKGLETDKVTVRRDRRRLLVEDWSSFEGLDDEEVEILQHENIVSSQSTPMISRKGVTIGVLSTQFSRPHRSSDEELRLVDLLAWSAADFVERHRAEADRETALDALADQTRFLEATLASIPACVYAFDRERRFAYANPAMEALYGMSQSELLGKTLADLDYPPNLVVRLQGHMDRIFRTGETIEDQVQYTSPTGYTGFFQFTWGPKLAPDGSVQWVVGASLDTTERRLLEERQRLLVHELNHRVKNTLATVQSMAAQTFRDSADTQQARAIFDSRLVALSKAHDILTQRSWEGASLRRVVDNVAPHGGQTAKRFTIDGPDVQVSPKYALALALALHELCTNAIKYGALSNAEGLVHIGWRIVERGQAQYLHLSWRETGGPRVQPPTRRGFGSRLLERGLKLDLGGTVELDYAPSGLVCTVTAPLATAGEHSDI